MCIRDRESIVELETHTVNPVEYQFLARGEIFRFTRNCPIAPRFSLRPAQVCSVDSNLSPARRERGGVPTHRPKIGTKHISVCICTYKRPWLLKRLLGEIGKQETGGLFSYSIVVADNDALRSAEATVS